MTAGVVTFEQTRAEARRHAVLVFVAGLVMLALVAGVVIAIVADFSGAFTTYEVVHADLPSGQPVEAHSQVEYLQIAVGTVAGVISTLPGGAVEVALHIKPGELAVIPADVTAQVAPSSVFGTEAVVLSAAHPSAAHLRAGALVPAGGRSTSLQGTLSDLDNLLNGLHPAEIDTTLGALSTALQGQGSAAGDALRSVNSYLDGLLPELPTLDQDIDLVSPVLNGLSASVPSLLDLADNSASVATTLSDEQALIGDLLAKGASLTGVAQDLLTDVSGSLHSFLVNLEPLLVDVNGRPGVLPAVLEALRALTTSFLPVFAESPLPAVTVSGFDYVSNPIQALLAASQLPISARQIEQLVHTSFPKLMDPPTYTAADCPHYGSEAGPNCPKSGTTTSATTHTTATSGATTATATTDKAITVDTADTVKTPSEASELSASEQSAINGLMKALEGRGLAQSSTADLLLAPLVQSLVP